MAFSVLMMASYVLFGGDSAREPLAGGTTPSLGSVQISAPALPEPSTLLPSLH